MKKYKAIIYDIDGTILNTLNMNMYPLIKIIKEELNEDWSFNDVLKFSSYPGMKVMEELNIKNKEEVYARWVKYVNEYEKGASLYEGFLDVFEKIYTNKIIQAIVSSKTREQYKIDIVEKGLDKYFLESILADDTIFHKPNPEPLLKCLSVLNLKSEDVLYIGDTYSDFLAAKNASIDFGYAKWGSISNFGIENPKFIFEKPIDILEVL